MGCVKPPLDSLRGGESPRESAEYYCKMNDRLAGMLLWAGWFLASSIVAALLKCAYSLITTRALLPDTAQNFAGAVIGIIALIVTLEIAEAYRGKQTS